MKIVLRKHNNCLVGHISWCRLAEQLRMAGEFREHEEPVEFNIDKEGIRYTIGERPPTRPPT
jgi:hypothetical protein